MWEGLMEGRTDRWKNGQDRQIEEWTGQTNGCSPLQNPFTEIFQQGIKTVTKTETGLANLNFHYEENK